MTADPDDWRTLAACHDTPVSVFYPPPPPVATPAWRRGPDLYAQARLDQLTAARQGQLFDGAT